MSRIRWRIAGWLDRLPFMCWANLVSWALGSAPLSDTRQDSICRSDMERCGICYCGKLRSEVTP
jgi:hypothetical protein